MDSQLVQHRVSTPALLVNEQLYVPHFTRAGLYVAHGNVIKTRAELLTQGAHMIWLRLWPRPEQQPLDQYQ